VSQVTVFVLTIFVIRKLFPRSFKLLPIHPVDAIKQSFSTMRSFLSSLSAGALVLLSLVTIFVLFSGLERYLTPIRGGDERMYHASRVLYWTQNRTIFPYATHNDRQNVFPYGSELFFLYPILFTKEEVIGRIVFWLGHPVAVIGLYFLLRELEIGKKISLAGTLIFTGTPIVIEQSVGLKPEIWLAVFSLGTGFWAVRAYKRPDRARKTLFFLALFSILSVNVKFTALSLLPAAIFLLWLLGKRNSSLKLGAALTGIAMGLLLSGLIVVFGFNLANHGHILGSKAMQDVHSSDVSAIQIYTHAVRFPFLLFEFPEVPSLGLRKHLSNFGNDVIAFLNADKPLPLERETSRWPGIYVYEIPEYADKFSLGGFFWLPMLILGLVYLLRDWIGSYPRFKLTPLSILVILELPFLCGVVFLVRWMIHARVPERFLVAPYAIGVVISTALLNRLFVKYKLLRAVSMILIAYMIYAPFKLQTLRIESRVVSPIPLEKIQEPFSEALSYIPAGSHILLVGSQGTRDYALFAPHAGYANQVTSWGKSPFDEIRMQDLIEDKQITHILVEDERAVGFMWKPHISTVEMVTWLVKHPGFSDIPLESEHMRLFESIEVKDQRIFDTLRAPSQMPLIIVDPSLQGKVSVDPTIRPPWPVEDAGPVEQGFLWLGTGPEEGLEGAIWSKDSRKVVLRFDVMSGPSRHDTSRTVSLSLWNEEKIQNLARSETFSENSVLDFVVQLEPGKNYFIFSALEEATIPVQPNGDARHLMVGLRQLSIMQHTERQ